MQTVRGTAGTVPVLFRSDERNGTRVYVVYTLFLFLWSCSEGHFAPTCSPKSVPVTGPAPNDPRRLQRLVALLVSGGMDQCAMPWRKSPFTPCCVPGGVDESNIDMGGANATAGQGRSHFNREASITTRLSSS